MADAALQPLIEQFAQETPKHFPSDQYRFHVVGLNEDFVRRLGGTMYLLFAAVALLLAIGCGNVSILLLARGTARQHEVAVRAAVGAGGLGIGRPLLPESFLLSLLGAGMGVFVAWRAIGVIIPRLPDHSYPYEADFHINLPVLFFSVGLAVLSGVIFGLFPALESSQPEISQVIQVG